MARRPARAVPDDDDAPAAQVRRRRRRGQRALARLVARVLRAPDHGLLHVLNLATHVLPGPAAGARPMLHARALGRHDPWGPDDPTHVPAPATPGEVRGWLVLDELAFTLIREAGAQTPVTEAALLRALRVMDHDPEARPLRGLALALWDQPPEWRRRLRHCDDPACDAPYFVARTLNRRDRYCAKSHEQRARRGWHRIRRGRTPFQRVAAVLAPGRLAPPSRP
jgi:hypothetical protein